ncbi:MAG TPA: hypothetical protein VK933_10850 [Longimicrobiales bacterium]|nr:hypothetical protein [Longimicrobiales bacterium]
MRTAALCLLPALHIACGSDSPSQPSDHSPAALEIASGNDQVAVVATSTDTRPTIRVTDDSGAGVVNIRVTFAVTTGGGWVTDATVTTDAAGYAATTWYLGPAPASAQTLRANAAGFSADFSATAAPLVEGARYTGVNSYVEFIAGDLPLIISAPHGGTLQPSSIPDRSAAGATLIRDADTDDLALAMEAAFAARGGGTPHIAVMHLHRAKLDANREIGEGAEGNRAAEHAWREYHGFIEAARHHVVAGHDRGLYIDLHGHGHDVQRLELGYLLTSAHLAGDDASLNAASIVQRSSIRTLAESSVATHAELLRGPASLGTMLEAQGYPAVPSSAQPHPGEAPYFTGGYSTARHGSRDGGAIDAVQIEANRVGVRDTEPSRQAFAAALALVVESWLDMHYAMALAR